AVLWRVEFAPPALAVDSLDSTETFAEHLDSRSVPALHVLKQMMDHMLQCLLCQKGHHRGRHINTHTHTHTHTHRHTHTMNSTQCNVDNDFIGFYNTFSSLSL